MSRVKRVGLSLVSALASESLVAALLILKAHDGSLGDWLGSVLVLSFYVIPGWLLSLPLVLLFDRPDGWRFWVLGIYGIVLGPAIIFACAVVGKVKDGAPIEGIGYISSISLVIALLSTALYLYLFKRSFRDSIEQAPS
jgi:hypothetical protein